MNSNLRHVVVAAREAGMDETTATGFAAALDRAGLIVDPTRTFGLVLHRRATGDRALGRWQREPLTEVEQQALAWDEARRRTQALANRIQAECSDGCGLLGVKARGTEVIVSVQVTDTAQWGAWRRYLGITEDTPHPEGAAYAYAGSGYRDGIAVWMLAYDAPQVMARATAAARMPHRLDGVLYDLALPLRDVHGDVWDYRETRADGMPLLVMRGKEASGRCSLRNVAELAGPLKAVREPEPVPGVCQPLPAEVEGGVSA